MMVTKKRFDATMAAIKKAKANLPPYPQVLLNELGASTNADWTKSAAPNFRGWTWYVGNCPEGYVPNNVSVLLEEGDIPDDLDISDIGYIGMWRGRTQSTTSFLYCVIPSMTHGEAQPGGVVDIGPGKLQIGWTNKEVERLVRTGWHIMDQMIEERGRYIPEP